MTDFGRSAGDMRRSVYDTDLDGVVDSCTTPGAHKTTHQDGGSDELDLTGLDGKSQFVDRGDAPSPDWDQDDLTDDDQFHDLDCSSIVPAGAKFIQFICHTQATSANKCLYIKKKGAGSTYTQFTLRAYTADQMYDGTQLIPCDENRKVRYYLSESGWTYVFITVGGWII